MCVWNDEITKVAVANAREDDKTQALPLYIYSSTDTVLALILSILILSTISMYYVLQYRQTSVLLLLPYQVLTKLPHH